MPGLPSTHCLIDVDSDPEADVPAFLFQEEAEHGQQEPPASTAIGKSRDRPPSNQTQTLMNSSDYSVQPYHRGHQTDEEHDDEDTDDTDDDRNLDVPVSRMGSRARQMVVSNRLTGASHMSVLQTEPKVLNSDQKCDGPVKVTSALTAMLNGDATNQKKNSSASSWKQQQTQSYHGGFKVPPAVVRPFAGGQYIPKDEVRLMETFKNKLVATKLIDQNYSGSRPSRLRDQEVIDTSDRKMQPEPQEQLTEGLLEKFEDLDFSPHTSTANDDATDDQADADDDDEEWEKIDEAEIDEETLQPVPIPSVIYQNATFKATMHEYVDRYSLSDEQKETLKGAWTILKWAGEFSYAVVSEPLVDAAEWVVKKKFGCDLEDLPMELRMRLMASLPENMQTAIKVTNRSLRRGGGFVIPKVKQHGEGGAQDGEDA